MFRIHKRKDIFMKMNMTGDKYNEMLNQDNDNQDEMSYTLRTHMKRNRNPICDYDMDAKRENKDIQKYVENYN
jgi:hypothetical protein